MCALARMAARCGNHSAIAMNAPWQAKRPRTRSFRPSSFIGAPARFPRGSTRCINCWPTRRRGSIRDAHWVMMPEFVLTWLGARRVSEYTHATHTGLVDLKTGDWSREVFRELGLSIEAAPPIVRAGTVVGQTAGAAGGAGCVQEDATVVPACHDTASAIAGIPKDMSSTAYISSGTWSLVGALTTVPVTTQVAFDAGYTNLGAATGDLMFHNLVNSMWVLKQCMDGWAAQGRPWKIEDIVKAAGECSAPTGIAEYGCRGADARYGNAATHQQGIDAAWATTQIADVPGNEPMFARVIFESLCCALCGRRWRAWRRCWAASLRRSICSAEQTGTSCWCS